MTRLKFPLSLSEYRSHHGAKLQMPSANTQLTTIFFFKFSVANIDVKWHFIHQTPFVKLTDKACKILSSSQNVDHFVQALTHWGRATHICISKVTIIASDNGLSPCRHQAIIWTNAGLLLIGPLGTNFNEILVEILTFPLKKCAWKCRLRNGVHLSRPQWVNALINVAYMNHE